MTAPTSATDPRAASEYRVPARTLVPGDLVNTGGLTEQDWQQVRNVYTAVSVETAPPAVASLLAALSDRYVFVELTDIAPVDSNIYFADDGSAYMFATDGGDDTAVLDAVGDADATRNYLYTMHELVTVRPASG